MHKAVHCIELCSTQVLNQSTIPHCQHLLFGGITKTASAYLVLSRLQQLPAVPQLLEAFRRSTSEEHGQQ